MILKVESLLVQYQKRLYFSPPTSYLHVTISCLIGANHWAVFPWHLSSLPDLFQPRVEGQSLHGRGPVEKTGEGGQTFQIYSMTLKSNIRVFSCTLTHSCIAEGGVAVKLLMKADRQEKPLHRHAVFLSVLSFICHRMGQSMLTRSSTAQRRATSVMLNKILMVRQIHMTAKHIKTAFRDEKKDSVDDRSCGYAWFNSSVY